jgi:hypothetical protein
VAGYLGISGGLVLQNLRKAGPAERHEKTVRPVVEPVRPVERMLLNLVLVNADARSHLMPRLKHMPALAQFATRRIFEAIFALDEAGEPVMFADLDARLEDNDRILLAAAVLADETDSGVFSLEQGEACLNTLENTQRDGERAELKAKVRAAERGGDLGEALRLSAELTRMDRG